jgi:hypothetical protein
MAKPEAGALQLVILLPIVMHKKGYAEDTPSTAGMWVNLLPSKQFRAHNGSTRLLLSPTKAGSVGFEYL